jgi:hypothetical protein
VRFAKARVSLLACALALALAGTAGATARDHFVEPSYAGGPHPTSGLSGFPARDYMTRGGTLVRAPFTGCVPTWRPWGRLGHQNPSAGFGGSRVYLERTKTGDEAYLAHFGLNHPYGDIYLRPGQCFRQGDPVGIVWDWPNNPGRSHIHMGYQGGDPLYALVNSNGTFRIQEGPTWEPGPDGQIFPRVLLRHEGQWWRVIVGEKKVYQGGQAKATEIYNARKLARTINLHFKNTYRDSPLVGWGLQMVRLFRARDLDPRLPAAIASCETSGGTRGTGPGVNNDFGLLLPQGGHRRFESRRLALAYLARLLDTQYVDKGFDTIGEISGKYAPVGAGNDPHNKNERWAGCVKAVYIKLNGTRFLGPHRPKVRLPELHKTLIFTAQGGAKVPGYWRVTRAGETLYQSQYRPALAFYREKRAYWERKA